MALAEQCWHQDPSLRPTFTEVVAQLRQLLYCVDQLQLEVHRSHARAIAVRAVAQEGM